MDNNPSTTNLEPTDTNIAPPKGQPNRPNAKTNPRLKARGTMKRKFPSKQHTDPQSKQTKSTFDKVIDAPQSTCFLLSSYFEVATSFFGVRHVTNIFYNMLRSRDIKLTNQFTADEFYYVILLSIYYRCSLITNYCKVSMIYGLSDMKVAVDDLLLPDSIAQYIETFGLVKLSNGSTVIPYFRGVQSQQDLGFVEPIIILDRINNVRQDMGEEPYRILHGWLCPEIIIKYSTAVSRAVKNAIQLRPVDNRQLEGRNEFLAGYNNMDHGRLECNAFDKITSAECQLGAAFRLHYFDLCQVIGIPLMPIYGAPPIDPETVLITHFTKNLRMVK